MAPKKDPEERSRELMAEMDRLIADGEAKLRESEEMFAKAGVPRGGASQVIASDKVTPRERAKAEAELAAFREEIARDLDAAVLVAKEAKPRTKVKPGAMRV